MSHEHLGAVADFTRTVARLSGFAAGEVRALADELLASRDGSVGVVRTQVNPEGFPIEYSVSASAQGLRHRLMGDPAATLDDGWERHQRARRALLAVTQRTGTQGLRNGCETLFRHMTRQDPEGLRSYPAGCFWMGTQLDARGLALFVTAEIPGGNCWHSLEQLVYDALPDPRPASDLLHHLRPFARLCSVGLEGTKPEDARLKVYWRLTTPMALSALGTYLHGRPEMVDFLRVAMDHRQVPASGFMADCSFSLHDGRLVDSKLLLCGHCLAWSPSDWVHRLGALCERFGLAAIPLGDALEETAVSFVAFGLDAELRPRLNLYLKPWLRP